MDFIGIDISKASFLAYNPDLGSREFQNDYEGFRSFRRWTGQHTHVVMEATGVYHLRLAHRLNDWGFLISVVSPLTVKRFAQMRLERTKTDRIDAVLIYRFAKFTQPPRWKPPATHLQQMIQMQSVMDQITRQSVSSRNALTTLKHYPIVSRKALNKLNLVAALQLQQVSELQSEIEGLVQKNYPSVYNLLVSIPAIGPKTANLLILFTDGFVRFENVKQLAAFAGIAPRTHQSGSITRGARISKFGPPVLRKYLYICSMRAIQVNAECKELYGRMKAAGKPGKVSIIAVSHKLLKQAFAVVRSGVPYQENYQQRVPSTTSP